jgi:sRNA-binding regulator protein Hfq
MKARIWRKLHAEEARRFDQAYELMGKTPGLELADAFALVQSGMSLDDFKARRARAERKTAVKEARGSVTREAVDSFLNGLQTEGAELSIVLGERTLLEVLKEIHPVAFVLEKVPRLEKLQVVLVARRSLWEKVSPGLERDAKTAQKPPPVAREPDKRPVSDPRAFLGHVGTPVKLNLRNGLQLTRNLVAVGPFDLLLGEADTAEIFIPLHAILRWEPVVSPEAAESSEA